MKRCLPFVAVTIVLTLLAGCEQSANPPSPAIEVAAKPNTDSEPPAVSKPGDKNAGAGAATSVVEGKTVRYLLPDRSGEEIKSSAAHWKMAAPVVDAFSNPNLIAYDQAYIDGYADWALHAPPACGICRYEIVSDDGVRTFDGGLYESYLGRRFRADHLMQLLQRRIDGPSREQRFEIQNAKALKTMAKHTDRGQLEGSPWERDICTSMGLLVGIEHKPVYPLIKALLKDPSDNIRGQALLALGRLAAVVPGAVDDITPFLDDKKLSSTAAAAIALADSAGVSAIIKSMDHLDESVRSQAVSSLALMDSKDAIAGLRAALFHKDDAIRHWAFGVLRDRQSRGADTFDEQVLDAVVQRLDDGDYYVRLQAAEMIRSFGPAAARSRPALVKAMNNDNLPKTKEILQAAIDAIDGKAPAKGTP